MLQKLIRLRLYNVLQNERQCWGAQRRNVSCIAEKVPRYFEDCPKSACIWGLVLFEQSSTLAVLHNVSLCPIPTCSRHLALPRQLLASAQPLPQFVVPFHWSSCKPQMQSRVGIHAGGLSNSCLSHVKLNVTWGPGLLAPLRRDPRLSKTLSRDPSRVPTRQLLLLTSERVRPLLTGS